MSEEKIEINDKKYYPAEYLKGQFNCPFCGVFAKQFWANLSADENSRYRSNRLLVSLSQFNQDFSNNWAVSKCHHCEDKIIWHDEKIIYPRTLIVEEPGDDLPDDIKDLYLEAANVFNDSPKASAALLRLAVQKLCLFLGGKGKNINDDIKKFVKDGLDKKIQRSLDILRVTGNNAVHPGTINIDENSAIVLKLFELINLIADEMITKPKGVSDFYDMLPDGDKKI